jgi:hypothetical protein
MPWCCASIETSDPNLQIGNHRPRISNTTYLSSVFWVDPKVGNEKKWKAVPLSEFIRLKGKSARYLPSFGVVEVMAQAAGLTYTKHFEGHTEDIHRDIIVPLSICARGTASVTYTAVDSAIPALSMRSMHEMAAHPNFRFSPCLHNPPHVLSTLAQ